MLDPLLSLRIGADDRVEQPRRPEKSQRLGRHRLRVHHRHENGLHGVLQLLRLGGGPAVHHDRPVWRDLPTDPATAQPPRCGDERRRTLLSEGAKASQVAGLGRLPFCAVLAAAAHPELRHLLLPGMPRPQVCHVRRHFHVPRELGSQPAGLRLPDKSFPSYADPDRPSLYAV